MFLILIYLARSGLMQQAGYSLRREGCFLAFPCGLVTLSTRAQYCAGLVSPPHPHLHMWSLSSLTRDWTHIPYIRRRILNPWTAREVPLLFRSWIIFCYIYIPHFLLPFIHQWTLGYFCLLVIAKNDVINMVVQISLQDPAFSFLDKMPRGRIAWSYGGSIYNFLGSLHIVSIDAAPFCTPTNSAQVF